MSKTQKGKKDIHKKGHMQPPVFVSTYGEFQ